ncbi:hypothetical protein JTB14_024330 [Gonioctena quinquepunctata]|nr:hypothetical protein JTB14_024330 [Gonioctena quinquepunctata]
MNFYQQQPRVTYSPYRQLLATPSDLSTLFTHLSHMHSSVEDQYIAITHRCSMFTLRGCAFLLYTILAVANGAKILGVFPYCAHSHFTLGFTLMKELADRGHEVTFINSFPQKNPIKNLRDVPIEGLRSQMDSFHRIFVETGKYSIWNQMDFMYRLSIRYTETVLKAKNVQDLLNSDEKFDLVILEQFSNEAMAIFPHKFNCPFVYFTPGPTTVINNHLFAIPAPPSYVPHILTTYASKMSFWQRLMNTFYVFTSEFFMHYIRIPGQETLLKRLFPDAPDLEKLIYNASLMLTMSHISIHDALPLQPSIKDIGGHHVLPIKPLPKNMKEFMDNATDGVVVFSMGSNLNSADFDPEMKRAILEAFSKIKQKVLWKFETDLEGKPSNVMISKWMPQQDALGHPNTVAFITHCGLLGTIEAVYYGVPQLGLPMFWDQYRNIEESVRRSMAIKLNYDDLTKETFEKALTEILENPKYRENAKLRSSIMRDQPMKQLDEAVFWVEYVIRHRGAPHLRSAAMDLRWYQKYMVDIFLFVGFVCTSLFVFFRVLFKYYVDSRRVPISDIKKNR